MSPSQTFAVMVGSAHLEELTYLFLALNIPAKLLVDNLQKYGLRGGFFSFTLLHLIIRPSDRTPFRHQTPFTHRECPTAKAVER